MLNSIERRTQVIYIFIKAIQELKCMTFFKVVFGVVNFYFLQHRISFVILLPLMMLFLWFSKPNHNGEIKGEKCFFQKFVVNQFRDASAYHYSNYKPRARHIRLHYHHKNTQITLEAASLDQNLLHV